MINHEVSVVRIIVEGRPSTGATRENINQARDMLKQAFSSGQWRSRVTFAVTPGGFIVAPFPKGWNERHRGWDSQPEHFQELVRHAQKTVSKVLTPDVLDKARNHVKFLTLGVDLKDRSGRHKTDRKPRGTHAELVAIIDVEQGDVPVQWTGKSYPLESQKRTLVQETCLKSHLLTKCESEKVLVLGCHDLNMFSKRARKKMSKGSEKYKRSHHMRELVEDFKPKIILHHPHSTDSPRVWATAWSGAREFLPRSHDGKHHIWASGIGYYHLLGKPPRRELCDVLDKTRCCTNHVIDICVTPAR